MSSRFVASYDIISFSIDLYLLFVGVGSLLQLNVIARPQLSSILSILKRGREGRFTETT